MKISELIKALELLAPPDLQEEYDNAGWIVGQEDQETAGCLVCLDVTEEVMDEAVSKNCRLVISHHPLIFEPLRRITGKTMTEKIVIKAIKQGIAIYSVHTNLDNVIHGVNEMLGSKLGLTELKILNRKRGALKKLVTFCPEDHAGNVRDAIFQAGAGQIGEYDQCSFNAKGLGTFRGGDATNPFVGKKGEVHFEPEIRMETIFPAWLEKPVVEALLDAHPYEEVAYDIYPLDNLYDKAGAGMIGELPAEMPLEEFLQMLKEVLRIPYLRHSKPTGKKVRRVAICGGSGSFLIPEAIRQQADVFVSADIKYHAFQETVGKLVIIDAGHFETEQFTCDLIAGYLIEKFPNFAVIISENLINPVNYF
jgi:dinuclear metal center YbgI/SA1388 family protein